MKDILQSGAKALGLALTDDMCDELETYYAHLVRQNQVMNLTTITDREEAARKHFLDSLALARAADLRGKRLIDVGTGAGFPGLPLKIAVPDLRVTLLDSQMKRVTFLREVCAELSLSEIEAVHGRAEEHITQPGERAGYDYATSRAVARLNVLCELCLPYLVPGGAFLAMKAIDSDEELEEAHSAIDILGGSVEACRDYTLPGTDIRHRIVVIRKVGPTPEKYPRRFAKIQKQPL